MQWKVNDSWIQYFEAKALGLMNMSVFTYAGTVRQMMQNGEPSGRIYYSRKTHRFYQASAPGEPPAIDSGTLVNSVQGSVSSWKDGVVGIASQEAAQYAMALEFGTTRAGRNNNVTILPRPYFRPALPLASRTVRQQMQGKL